MKTIYFVSGLGADERAFQHLQQNGITGKLIKWVAPKKHESLRDYCMRLTDQLDAPGGIILIGVSFGGIVAQELSKLVKVDKVIILSSIKSPEELSRPLNAARALGLHRLFPPSLVKWAATAIRGYLFGATTRAERELLRLIIRDTDTRFVGWAIEVMMRWRGGAPSPAVVHIHGDKDRIFPIGRIKSAITIAGGSHFMIVNRAKEIAEIIKKEIG